ncbi:MAG TPA: MGMT family protein [Terriglobales bacterium]|nr:MGMT family protein [Terriglobales bacterium]
MFDAFRRTIRQIPKGKVSSYGAIAHAAGYPGSARQVAWALHVSDGLPWHRVVGSGGKILLTGHSAQEQRLRLEMEGVVFAGARIPMKMYEFKFLSGQQQKKKRKRKSKGKKQGSIGSGPGRSLRSGRSL